MNIYKNNGKLKVYLASPFFNEEQVERIEFVESELDKYGFDVFSPRKASTLNSSSTQADMIETFNGNIEHIDTCDFMLAILDGYGKNSDTGTVFETGYAYAKHKPILYFNETREKKPNLMLALSGRLPFITATNTGDNTPREALDICLSDLMQTGLDAVIEKTKLTFTEVE